MTAAAAETESRLLDRVGRALTGPSLGVMLYGSCARGDGTAHSDVDVLQLVARPRSPYEDGPVSVTPYTPEHLRILAEAGSLFVLHLRTEGRILRDPDGLLASSLSSYAPPASYEPLRAALRSAGAILDADSQSFGRNGPGLTRVALFLLRTALYAVCAERGCLSFSMARVASTLGDPRIAALYRPEQRQVVDPQYFGQLRGLFEEYLSTRCTNPHGTLEALATSAAGGSPLTSVLAIRVLSGEVLIRYDTLPLDWFLG